MPNIILMLIIAFSAGASCAALFFTGCPIKALFAFAFSSGLLVAIVGDLLRKESNNV